MARDEYSGSASPAQAIVMIHPNDYFDRIYCLNLDRRIGRWQCLSQRLARRGIRAQRFAATDGNLAAIQMQYRHLLNHPTRSGRRRQQHAISSAGAFGCLLSHIEILRDACRHGYRRILVFEDDIRLHYQFLSVFQKVIQLPPDWRLLYLGASQHQWQSVRCYNESFYYARRSQGTFAVAIAHSLYHPLLKLLQAQQHVADRCFSAVQGRHPGHCFVFSPNLAIADVTTSDIRPARNQLHHASRMRWDLRLYEPGTGAEAEAVSDRLAAVNEHRGGSN